MRFDEIKNRLAPLARSDLQKLSAEAGVPFHTVRKIVSGETPDPRVSTIEALSDYFEKQEAAA